MVARVGISGGGDARGVCHRWYVQWSQELGIRRRRRNHEGATKRWLTGLLCCLLGLIVMAALSACGPDETDREALVALFKATSGEYWEDKEYWLTDAPLHKWSNVTTNEEGRVTELLLAENGLNGEIPPELGDLTSLEVLDLGEGVFDVVRNSLSGEIPPELGNLANLKLLDLSWNDLNGEIPAELGNLANLKSLDLSDNDLNGCIPNSLRGRANNRDGEFPWC